MVALAGPAARGVREAAVVAGAHPCTGLCPPEGAWGNFPLLHPPLPPNPRLHHLPLPKNINNT